MNDLCGNPLGILNTIFTFNPLFAAGAIVNPLNVVFAILAAIYYSIVNCFPT